MSALAKSGACLAIDAGGVVFHKNSGGDQSDRSRGPIPGAFEALSKLKNEDHRLLLVSFAGRKTATITVNDVKTHFPDMFDNIYIVKDKKEKIALCRYLGADAMIDDTVEVHHNIKEGIYLGKPKMVSGDSSILRILFTGDGEDPEAKDSQSLDVIASTWEEVYQACSKLTHTHSEDKSIVVKKYIYPEFTNSV